jgi:hypothetical protein
MSLKIFEKIVAADIQIYFIRFNSLLYIIWSLL